MIATTIAIDQPIVEVVCCPRAVIGDDSFKLFPLSDPLTLIHSKSPTARYLNYLN